MIVVHTTAACKQNGCVLNAGIPLGEAWHVLAVEWTPTTTVSTRCIVNNTHTVTAQQYACHRKFSSYINIAMHAHTSILTRYCNTLYYITLKNSMRFFVDDMEHCSMSEWWTSGALDNPAAPFDKPFYIKLSLAVGGDVPQVATVDAIPAGTLPMEVCCYVHTCTLHTQCMHAGTAMYGCSTLYMHKHVPACMLIALNMHLHRPDAVDRMWHINTYVRDTHLPLLQLLLPLIQLPQQYQIDYVRVFEMTPAEAKLTKYPFPGKVIPAKTPGYPDDLAAAGSYHVNFKTAKLAPSPLIQASVRIDMEHYDYGGQGVGYNDSTPLVNTGNCALRPHDG
eukprot:9977-Heterococcus_DN1.PRE.3